MEIKDRFLEYVKIDTQSSYNPDTVPSTEKQRTLALLLESQMKNLGVSDVYLSEECCLYGTLKANYEECKAPKIGFCLYIRCLWIRRMFLRML